MSGETRATPTASEIIVGVGKMRDPQAIAQLAQRLADALAEVERLSRSVALWEEDATREHKNAHFWRERAESAEATLKLYRDANGTTLLDVERYEAAEADARYWKRTAGEHAQQASDLATKLAEAQQREAKIWEATLRTMGMSAHDGLTFLRTEIRRLLCLEDAK